MAGSFPVITGLGIVTAAGCGVEEVWRAIASKTTGLTPLTLFESPRYGQVLTGEIKRDLPALGAPSRGSRSDRLGWLAAREAIQHAGIKFSECGDRAGIVLGASVGGSFDSERFLTALIKQGRMRARPTRYHECCSTVEIIADDFGLFGPSTTLATACSSSALAIAMAADLIMAGEADVMLAGGADSLSRMTWGGFHSLLLVDSAGCRPFDAQRAGMSLGEGAAVLVIESEKFARNRNAKILARLTGWGASCDAHHATAPDPQGAGAAAAMRSALRRAALEPDAIDYINAHGTGTRDNDVAEANALKTIFGERIPPVSSTKRFFGHALGASGAIEAVVSVEALRRQQIPPNPGFAELDPAIGLTPVAELEPAELAHVMSNSFGFGGNNAVLIFSRPEVSAHTLPPRPGAAAITGISVIRPGEITQREIEAPLPPGTVTIRACDTQLASASFNPNQRRRLSRIEQMTLACARRANASTDARRVTIAIGTGLGCLADAGAFIENLISKDEREPMPTRFPRSVHNSSAAQSAIDLHATGQNSAPTFGEISFECALWQGMSQLASSEADSALVGAVDELNKYPLAIGKRWGLWNEKIISGEGAVVASLTPIASAKTRLASVRTIRLGRYRRPFDAVREADWIASAIELTSVDTFLSGAKGWPELDGLYADVFAVLSSQAKNPMTHRTYKEQCGEFHSASAFGFSLAIDLIQNGCRGVLLYTLSQRGGKALCCLQP